MGCCMARNLACTRIRHDRGYGMKDDVEEVGIQEEKGRERSPSCTCLLRRSLPAYACLRMIASDTWKCVELTSLKGTGQGGCKPLVWGDLDYDYSNQCRVE